MTAPSPEDPDNPRRNASPPTSTSRALHLDWVVLFSLGLSALGTVNGLWSIPATLLVITQASLAPAGVQLTQGFTLFAMLVLALVTLGFEGFAAYASWLTHRRLERGRQLLVNTALPLVFALTSFRILWTAFTTYRLYDALALIEEQAERENFEVEIIVKAMTNTLWIVLLLAFYVWARHVLRSDDVVVQFKSAP